MKCKLYNARFIEAILSIGCHDTFKVKQSIMSYAIPLNIYSFLFIFILSSILFFWSTYETTYCVISNASTYESNGYYQGFFSTTVYMRKAHYNVFFNFPNVFLLYNLNSDTSNQESNYIINRIQIKSDIDNNKVYGWAITKVMSSKSFPIYIAYDATTINTKSTYPPVTGWFAFNTSTLSTSPSDPGHPNGGSPSPLSLSPLQCQCQGYALGLDPHRSREKSNIQIIAEHPITSLLIVVMCYIAFYIWQNHIDTSLLAISYCDIFVPIAGTSAASNTSASTSGTSNNTTVATVAVSSSVIRNTRNQYYNQNRSINNNNNNNNNNNMTSDNTTNTPSLVTSNIFSHFTSYFHCLGAASGLNNYSFEKSQFYRIVSASVCHFEIFHLGFNMYALYQLMEVETFVNSLKYLYLSVDLVIITMWISLLMYHILITKFNRVDYINAPCVGYSCVLFAWMVVWSVNMREFCPIMFLPSFCFETYFVIPGVPINIGPIILLFITKLIIPRSSFLGHLSGIIIGYPLTWGLLDWLTPYVVVPLCICSLLFLKKLFFWELSSYSQDPTSNNLFSRYDGYNNNNNIESNDSNTTTTNTTTANNPNKFVLVSNLTQSTVFNSYVRQLLSKTNMTEFMTNNTELNLYYSVVIASIVYIVFNVLIIITAPLSQLFPRLSCCFSIYGVWQYLRCMYLTENLLVHRNGLDFIYLSLVFVVTMLVMDCWTLMINFNYMTYLTTASNTNSNSSSSDLYNFYMLSMCLYATLIVTGIVYISYLLTLLQYHSPAKAMLSRLGLEWSQIKSFLQSKWCCCCSCCIQGMNHRSFGSGSLSAISATSATTSVIPSTSAVSNSDNKDTAMNQKKSLNNQQLSRLQNIKSRMMDVSSSTSTHSHSTNNTNNTNNNTTVYNPLMSDDVDEETAATTTDRLQTHKNKNNGHTTTTNSNNNCNTAYDYQQLPAVGTADSATALNNNKTRSNKNNDDLTDTITL